MKPVLQPTPLASTLIATGLLALALPAFAQTPPPAGAASAPASRLDEVIVTATKVATPASKTPISLTVVTGEDLKSAGATDARALTNLAPNVNIAAESGRMQINIRGVMSIDQTERGDPSSAFHVDGMYIGRPEAQLGGFLDLQRVEVLRGPQGTLYGRNATAGAINLITNKPSKTREASVGVEFGNYNTVRSEGMLNLPVNDVLSLRGAFNTQKRDTFLKAGPLMQPSRGLEDQDDYAARVHGLLTFSPDTSLLLTAETSHQGGVATTAVPLTNFYSGTSVGGGNDLLGAVPIDRGTDARVTINNPTYPGANQRRDNTANILRGEFKTTLGWADLTYQLGYLKSSQDVGVLGTFNGNRFFGDTVSSSKQLSNEVRLNSTGTGPFKWLVGAYALNEDVNRTVFYNSYINPAFTFSLKFVPIVKNSSRALFGQGSYALTDSLRVVAGLRGTRDKKESSDPFGGGGVTIPAAPYSRSADFSKTTWKVGLDWDITKKTFGYASLSTGYKAGTFNAGPKSVTNPDVKPELLTSLELGVKTRLFEDKLQISTSVFNYNYKDQQVTSNVCLDPTNPTSCASITKNTDSKIRGLEVEGVLRASDDDRFTFGASYNKSQYKGYRPVDTATTTISFDGQPLDRAPKGTLRFGYAHTFNLSEGAQVVAAISTRYSSAYYVSAYSAAYAQRYQQPHYNMTDLNLTYNSADGKYFIQGYVRNLEDTLTIQAKTPGAVEFSDPRRFGVRAGYTFW